MNKAQNMPEDIEVRVNNLEKYTKIYPNLETQISLAQELISKEKSVKSDSRLNKSENIEVLLALQTENHQYVYAKLTEKCTDSFLIEPYVAVHALRGIEAANRDPFNDFSKVLDKGFIAGINIFKVPFLATSGIKFIPRFFKSLYGALFKGLKQDFRYQSIPNVILYDTKKLTTDNERYGSNSWAVESRNKDVLGDRFYLEFHKYELLGTASRHSQIKRYPCMFDNYSHHVVGADVQDISFTVMLYHQLSNQDRTKRIQKYEKLLSGHNFTII